MVVRNFLPKYSQADENAIENLSIIDMGAKAAGEKRSQRLTEIYQSEKNSKTRM
jgi:hypothetical protein